MFNDHSSHSYDSHDSHSPSHSFSFSRLTRIRRSSMDDALPRPLSSPRIRLPLSTPVRRLRRHRGLYAALIAVVCLLLCGGLFWRRSSDKDVCILSQTCADSRSSITHTSPSRKSLGSSGNSTSQIMDCSPDRSRTRSDVRVRVSCSSWASSPQPRAMSAGICE